MRRHFFLAASCLAALPLVGLNASAQTGGEEDTTLGEQGEAADEAETGDLPTNTSEESNASALEGGDEITLRVQQHDARAQELFARGDYEEALAEQRQAQALLPATPRLFNMAVCEERLGHLEAAVDLYGTFLASDDAPADRRGQARQRIEHLTEQLAAARAAEAATTAEADAHSDSQLSASDATPRDRSVALAPATFWATLGVSIACGITTVVLGAVTLVRHEEFLGLYRDDPLSPQLQEQGTNLALATNIMIGVTAFTALTALVFGLDTNWNRRQDDEREEEVALVPAVGPGGGGLTLMGRY